MKSKIWCIATVFVYASIAGLPNMARAADLDVSDTPLFAAVSIEPNIMFTLDDSGSMQWEGMPVNWAYLFPQADSPYGGTTYGRNIPRFRDNYFWNLRLRNPQLNGVFYNPELEYQPWARADGTSFPDANPDAALRNPFLPDRGTLDLDSLNSWNNWSGGGPNDTGDNEDFWPITFYMYDGVGNTDDPANHTKYQIRGNFAFRADPANAPMVAITQFNWPNGIVRSVEEEKQNFANWFTYSRSRVLAARNGIGRAFAELPEQARVGFGAINQGNTNVDGVGTRTLVTGVRDFSGAGRVDFYDRLYGRVINGFGTPLRRAAEDVGEYFERTDARGPWSTTPGVDSGTDLACRQSYHILMTDGFWNGANPDVGNSDNLAGPVHTAPDGETGGYTPTDPFRDTRANTLGDVGMDFWKRDLRTDLENRVPTNEVDTAFWQHLTTFGIGLGVTGNLDPEVVEQAVVDGTAINWGNPLGGGDVPDKIDDLLHFGINGRGGYFSAADPDTFAAQLGEILRDIVARSGATTGLSASSTRLNAGAVVYTAGFDSENWSGDLQSLDAVTGTEIESAATRLEALGFAGRSIFTWDPDEDDGVSFEPSGEVADRVMDSAPPAWTAAELFDYLKGDLTAGSGVFRVRDSMLGDIVGSQPVFSGPGNEGWSDIDLDYLGYIDNDKRDPRDPCGEPTCPGERRNTVFVGANDGMLHAFDAVTLEEHFAYVPAAVHKHLYQLADPGYTHRYFVDGQMAIADAEIGSGTGGWGTFLVGSLGAGGRGIYALDVTQPQNFTADDVKWEITAEDDPDIGLTFGKPAIGRTSGGDWIAVFGNGYNSEDNQAYLYVVNLETGLVVPGGKVAVGDPGANGLSGVALVPSPDDPLSVKYIYAGDLQGNMWRFDVAANGAPTPSFGADDPLFTDPDGRPIIASPNVALHPTDGFMVYFGTGKLIENSDRLNSTTLERFYALRDLGTSLGDDLSIMDKVTVTGAPGGGRVFTPTGSGINGWYAELSVGTPSGERVLFSPLVFAGRVVFASYEPANDPCTPGGIQRAYVLRALSGSGALPDDTNPNLGGIEVGAGAAFAPVIGIKNPVTATGNPGDDPGRDPDPDCDPGDPGCNPDFDDAPIGALGFDRDNWCRTIGLQQPGSWVPIGQLCEGRQAWRQIR